MRIAAVLLALAAPVAGEPMTAPEAVLWSKLRDRIEAVERGLDGVLGVAVKDLKTGTMIEVRANDVFPAASTIKLAILYELYRQAEDQSVDLGEVTHPPPARVGGGGVLYWLGDKVSLTWRDLAVLMIGFSDNEATNLLISRVGMDAVNRRLAALGLQKTQLRRRMMDLPAARRGDENVSTPAEMLRLLETIRAGVALSPPHARDLAAVASTPEARSAFRAPLPPGIAVLAKSGDLTGVRCEVAEVDLAGRPYRAAIMTTYLERDPDGEAAIRDISSALYETFDRLARASAYGRIIDER